MAPRPLVSSPSPGWSGTSNRLPSGPACLRSNHRTQRRLYPGCGLVALVIAGAHPVTTLPQPRKLMVRRSMMRESGTPRGAWDQAVRSISARGVRSARRRTRCDKDARCLPASSSKDAYRSCVKLAVGYQYFDERTQACGAWLSSHSPAEFPRVDEIRDRPSWLSSCAEQMDPTPPRRTDRCLRRENRRCGPGPWSISHLVIELLVSRWPRAVAAESVVEAQGAKCAVAIRKRM